MTGLIARLIRRQRDEHGASAVELSLLAPVFFGCIGLGLFAAHVYEVKSDLQHAAQRTARFGAIRCDYRGDYPPGSGCETGDHRSAAELIEYANQQFDTTFVEVTSGPCELGSEEAVLCRTFDPSTPAGPVANQRVRVVLRYRHETPLAPFLRAIQVDDVLVDLEGRGEATVE